MKNSKNRVIALVCALSLALCLCLSGCGSSSAPAAASGDTAAAASGSIWAGVSENIDMQCHQSSTEQLSSSYDHMIDLVSKVTDGAITIKAYESGSLYSTADCLEAVKNGDLIMCEAAEGSWYDNVPVSIIAAGLPFIYSSYEQAYMFMFNRGFYELLNEAYAEQNIHVIPYECYTASIISKSPITDLASIQGRKLRASGSMAKFEDLVGAAVTTVSGSELYSALSQGIVDGATWGSAQAMVQMNLQEVCSYYMDPDPIIGQWNCIYVNLDWWNALTVDQQNALESCIQMAGYDRTIATEANNVRTKNLFTSQYGVTIQTLDSAAISEFSTYGMQLLEQFGQADDYSARAVELIKAFNAEYESGMIYNNTMALNNK